MVIGSVPEWKQDESVGPNMGLVTEWPRHPLQGFLLHFLVIYFSRYDPLYSMMIDLG